MKDLDLGLSGLIAILSLPIILPIIGLIWCVWKLCSIVRGWFPQSPNIIRVRDPLDDHTTDSAYPTKLAEMVAKSRQRLRDEKAVDWD